MAPPIDLVVFDLGGVLVRTAGSWTDAHRRAGLRGELPTDPGFWALVEELGERADGSLAAAEFYEAVASASAGHYRPEDVARIGRAWLRGEYPGTDRVFDALDAAGIDTALLSNTNDAHWAQMFPTQGDGAYPTLRRARHRFASHLLGLMKPDPRIYAVVERRTGHAGSRVLFFDDREVNVEGARRAGWQAVPIDPLGDTAAQMLDALARHGIPTAG